MARLSSRAKSGSLGRWCLKFNRAQETFPTFISPMMANNVKEPFDSLDWIFEVKLDGYRGIAVFDAPGKPHLWSRNGLPLEKKLPAVAGAF
jgi:bifunctional non-homologous end joining protein LigD